MILVFLSSLSSVLIDFLFPYVYLGRSPGFALALLFPPLGLGLRFGKKERSKTRVLLAFSFSRTHG